MKSLFEVLNEKLNQENVECSFQKVGTDVLYQKDIDVKINDTYVTISTRGVFFEGKQTLLFLELSREDEERLFLKAYGIAEKKHNKNMEQFKSKLI